MNPQNIWLKRTGLVLNILIAALMLFAGASKLLGLMPAEEVAKMGIWKEKMLLVGFGEVVTAVLFIIPWTAPLGTLLMSGLWGGIIATNMAQGQPYWPWAVMLLITWLGAYLRGTVPILAPPKSGALAATD